MYNMDRFALLYYGDSVSHLIGARKLFDWYENPGFSQVGTVWLPLPHFVMMFPSMIDSLFFSGFAGLAISLPSLALTSVFIFKILVRILSASLYNVNNRIISYIAVGGALLYALNPNFLYIGITAMTEALFMLFFVGSAYYLLKLLESSFDGTNYRQQVSYTLLLSIFASAACLCRYESWILPVFIVLAVTLIKVLDWKKMAMTKRFPSNILRDEQANERMVLTGSSNPFKLGHRHQIVTIIMVSTISFSGIAFWLSYNHVIYGNAFEFETSRYSAASQAASRSIRETLYLQPLNIVDVYGRDALLIYGPLLLAAAAIGYFLLSKKYFKAITVGHKQASVSRSLSLLLLYFSLPPIFTVTSLFIGVGEMTLWFFNSRFLILLAPLLIALSAFFVLFMPGPATKRIILSVGIIASFFVFQSAMPAYSMIPTLLDAKGGFQYGQAPYTVAVGDRLREIYDGKGLIMIITGSMQEHRILISSGIPLHNYDEIIQTSTWKKSFYEPWKYGERFIVLSKEPDSDAASVVKYWKDHRALLDEHYHQVFESKFYEILALN